MRAPGYIRTYPARLPLCALLLPLFFAMTGLRMRADALQASDVVLCVVVIVVATAGKLLGYKSDPPRRRKTRFAWTPALPDLDESPIELVAEVQLHLTYYLQQRKKTHLWFKILRAADLESLRRDCAEYANLVRRQLRAADSSASLAS